MTNPSDDSTQNERTLHLTLSEAAEAADNALQGCRAELDRLRQQLRASLPEDGERASAEAQPGTPQERAVYIVSRLEACAETLRKAAEERED